MKNKTRTKSINKKQVKAVKKEIPPSQKSLLSKKNKNEETGKNKPGLKDFATLRKRSTKPRNSGKAEKYWNILENIQDGCLEVDLPGNFTFLNDSVCRALGYSREELMEMNVRQLSDKETLKKVFQVTNEVYKTGKHIKELGWQVTRKDGAERYIQGSISLRKDSSGNPIGFLVIANDITERKQAEEKLRESEASYRQLFDNSPAVIYRVDFKSGRFLKANDVFCEYFGCSQEEITSLNPYDILTEESKKLFLERMEKISQGIKVPDIVEYEVLDKKGKRWCLHLHNKNIYDAEGHVVASDVVAHDITERKQAEVKLQHTLDSLRKAHGTIIQVMVSAVEMRDPYTAGHQVRTADIARAIATEMGLPEEKIDGIRLAGSIHDIGKLSIPAELLSKPTKLTNIEFSLIKEHPRIGYELLKDVESPWPLAEIVYQHHERMNGTGYPRNLKGDEILLEARIMAVADVIEAMASHRPYRPTLGIEAALEEIEKNKGIIYDNVVADACLKLFREKSYQLK
jgi:PAS domain S-box-containing protein